MQMRETENKDLTWSVDGWSRINCRKEKDPSIEKIERANK